MREAASRSGSKMPSRNRRSRRRRIYERDGHQCLRCGSTEDLTLDHIVPLAAGGSHANSNLQTLCEKCNQRKGNRAVSYLDPEVQA